MDSRKSPPLVSIGLPVYNGAQYLRICIDSVLSQTFRDFELIIRDNASTDETEIICREFAEQDDRVRYLRSSSKVGAAVNFNAIVPEARGKYFKWIAHDDVIAPTFLRRCVEVLEEDHRVVLAYSRVRYIDTAGNLQEQYVPQFRAVDSSRVNRFGKMLQGHCCFEAYGVIRTDRLRETNLIGSYFNGDGILLAHLALLGTFAEIQEDLMLSRRHAQQSVYVYGITDATAKLDVEAYARWMCGNDRLAVSRSHTKALREYWHMIRMTPMSRRERHACYRLVLRWTLPRLRCIAGEWKRSFYELLGLDARSRHVRMEKRAV